MCPRLFTIGSFSLPTYGVLVAIGFLVGLYVAGRLARRSGFDPEKITNLGVYIFLAAIVGAKAFMILHNFDYYVERPGQILSLSSLQAGGVFYGGLLAAIGTAIWFSASTACRLWPLRTLSRRRWPSGIRSGAWDVSRRDVVGASRRRFPGPSSLPTQLLTSSSACRSTFTSTQPNSTSRSGHWRSACFCSGTSASLTRPARSSRYTLCSIQASASVSSSCAPRRKGLSRWAVR